ncbi:MAG: ADOP family duplicated permease [Vicinamibacterales bacterium]
MTPTPPAAAERLLRWSVRDPEWRDAVSGDLREEFATLALRGGEAAARRWYWRQALALGARFTAGRVVPGALPHRPSNLAFSAPEVDGGRLGSGWGREVRHAWRSLWHRPALTGVIVITLATALAANATIFNLADALYLRPFRFEDASRLVMVSTAAPSETPFFDRESVAPADFRDWVRDVHTITGLAAAQWWDPNLSGRNTQEAPERLAGFRVSADFFRTLGVRPALGRDFTAGEDVNGQHRVVLLSHALWQRRFGGDPGILGQSLRIDGEMQQVVGIMPPGFQLPFGAEVWAPLGYTDEEWADRQRAFLMVLGRLADGQSVGAAQAELAGLVRRQAAAFPDTNSQRVATVASFTEAMRDPGAGPFLAIWQAAALLLLVIACANVANLLLARGTERQQEFALRLALGAGRARLLLQLLIEGVCLAVLAVAAAVPLAWVGASITRDFLPANIVRFVPGYQFLGLDAASLAVVAGLAVLASVIFSLGPAIHAARSAVADTLRQGGRTTTASTRRQWGRALLATGQVALTLALVVASAVILGAVDEAVNGAIGFDKRNLITATLTLPDAVYDTPQERRQFVDTVLQRLGQVPAITRTAASSSLPYEQMGSSRPFYPEGVALAPAEARTIQYSRVTPGYHETMGVPLLAGRLLTDDDREETRPVAVVSRSLADRYWPGEPAVGHRFRLAEDGPWVEVVGVVGDLTEDWFMRTRTAAVYRPMAQDPSWAMAITARTVGDPVQAGGALRQAVAAADPDLPVAQVRSMNQVVADKVAGINFLANALAVMSLIALALALMGMYSLMAFMAARRTQEIGVRLALGASRWEVIRLTGAQALKITAAGVVVGAALAFALGRVMESALFGLVTLTPWVLLGVALGLTVVALAAGYLPARRASRLDPALALRTE